MKISNPYTSGTVTMPPDTITRETNKAAGKAKARYPDKALTNMPGGGGSNASSSYKRALTPGTSPSGS